MSFNRRKLLIVALLVIAVSLPVLAVTMVEVEVICPICHTKNTFYQYASYGDYVYMFPSRFQLLFWPYTYSATIYSCRKCHLSLYMWDFRDFPKEKVPETEKILSSVQMSGIYKTYTDIPASQRLETAEKVYHFLGKDDFFWEHFYRLLGYYYAQEKKPQDATRARRQALEINQRMIEMPENSGRKKELLVIAASMHHFLGDDVAAKKELETATSLNFVDEKIGLDKSKNHDEFLSVLIQDYKAALAKNEVPGSIN